MNLKEELKELMPVNRVKTWKDGVVEVLKKRASEGGFLRRPSKRTDL